MSFPAKLRLRAVTAGVLTSRSDESCEKGRPLGVAPSRCGVPGQAA